jgi:predicted NBD/HSP70 family sugar kinase
VPHSREQPADRAGLRRANLALLIRLLRQHGGQSRAQLAGLSGLSKATVSNLVADLEGRRLVQFGGVAPGGQGRPGQLVELCRHGMYGIGIEIGVGHIETVVVDVAGAVVRRRRELCDVLAGGLGKAIDELAALGKVALDAVRARGGWPAGITVAVPGLVDVTAGVVRLAPRLRWREVALADELAARLDLPLARIAIDNDANLSATAEYEAGGVRGTADLVHVTGGFGVGAGVIADGRLVRGTAGLAGEIGHMSMNPLGPYCSCGRRGCWETQIGVGALFHALRAGPAVGGGADPVANPDLDLSSRMAIVRARAERGDRHTLGVLNQIGTALGVGVSIVVNLVNPSVVVLGGYFAALPEWLVEPARIEVASRTLAAEVGTVNVVASELGFSAASTGGAHTALRRVFDDPTVVPVLDGNEEAPA